MRLIPGTIAPNFDATDIHGRNVQLSDYSGKKLFLSFYRYAACPLCNLRVHELIQRQKEFGDGGVEMLAVFESSTESIKKRVGKQEPPFPIVGDPDHAIYDAYGVETSWSGFFAGMATPKMMKAFSKGFLPGKMEGEISRLPADFLIRPDRTIQDLFYAGIMSSHMPIQRIEKFAAQVF